VAFASYGTAESFNLNSEVFRFNASSEQFARHQLIPTHGAHSFHFFILGGNSFLAVANMRDITDSSEYDTNSEVLRFNSSTGLFDFFQWIPTHGAADFDSISVGNDFFLAVANQVDGTNNLDIYSEVFCYSTSMAQFVSHQSILSHRANALHFLCWHRRVSCGGKLQRREQRVASLQQQQRFFWQPPVVLHVRSGQFLPFFRYRRGFFPRSR